MLWHILPYVVCANEDSPLLFKTFFSDTFPHYIFHANGDPPLFRKTTCTDSFPLMLSVQMATHHSFFRLFSDASPLVHANEDLPLFLRLYFFQHIPPYIVRANEDSPILFKTSFFLTHSSIYCPCKWRPPPPQPPHPPIFRHFALMHSPLYFPCIWRSTPLPPPPPPPFFKNLF